MLAMAADAFDRQAPLTAEEQALLQRDRDEVAEPVAPRLEGELLDELHALIDPGSPRHLLSLPQLTMAWLSVLAQGRKPTSPAPGSPAAVLAARAPGAAIARAGVAARSITAAPDQRWRLRARP